MKRIVLILAGLSYACTPGQAKQNGGDVISDYQWEPGATEPVIEYGEVYCTTSDSDTLLTFINVQAIDPQGAADLKEGTWSAYRIANDELVVTDVLYCDGQECIYSFHAAQYPELPCAQLEEFYFLATVTDWSGNQTETVELEVLGEL